MTGTDGTSYMFTDTHNVIDCAHDAILGLPSIVSNVLPLLTNALVATKDRSSVPASPDTSEQLTELMISSRDRTEGYRTVHKFRW